MAIVNEHAVKAARGVMLVVTGEPVLCRENQAALFGGRDARCCTAVTLIVTGGVSFVIPFTVSSMVA
jgi:hypothetical protein